MAVTKITELGHLNSGDISPEDVFIIDDVSILITKKLTIDNLQQYLGNVHSVASNLFSFASETNSLILSLANSTSDAITNLSIDINEVQSNLTSLTVNTSAALFGVNSDISALSSNIDSVQSSLTTNINLVSSNVVNEEIRLRANIDTISSNVDSLDIRVTSNIDLVQANLYSEEIRLSANIDTVSSNVDSLDIRLTANIDLVQSNVYALDTRLSSNIDVVSSNVDNALTGNPIFSGSVTVNENLTVLGNLLVAGNNFSVNTSDLFITDRTITLSNGAISATFDSGIVLTRGTDGNVFIGFDESEKEFIAAYTSNTGSNSTLNYVIDAYANAHFNNIQLEGLVNNVDVEVISANLNIAQANITSLYSNIDIVSIQATSNLNNVITGNTAFTAPITFESSISASQVNINNNVSVLGNSISNVGPSETTILTFSGAEYRAAELVILVQDVTTTEYQLSKLLIVHDNEKVDWTDYGTVYTGSSYLNSFNVSINESNVVSVYSIGGSSDKKITVASKQLIN